MTAATIRDTAPSARRLRSLFGARSAQAQREIDAVLTSWGAQWDVRVSVLRCTDAHEQLDAPLRWMKVCAPESSLPALWLGSTERGVERDLEKALFGADAAPSIELDEPPRTIAVALAEEALIDLATRLLALQPDSIRDGRAASIAAGDAPPRKQMRPWSGAMAVSLKVERRASVVVHLHVPERFASAWLPAAPLAMVARESVSSSVTELFAEHPVRVRALLASTSISLGDLMSLRPGDVILTPHEVDAPLLVSMSVGDRPEAHVEASGAADLGARGSHFALSLHARPPLPGMPQPSRGN